MKNIEAVKPHFGDGDSVEACQINYQMTKRNSVNLQQIRKRWYHCNVSKKWVKIVK